MLHLKLSHRLDSAVLSSDALLSLHVGDQILEVNGVPVRNLAAEEVGLIGEVATTGRPKYRRPEGGITLFLQVHCAIQDTTKPLQLTIEHNPQPHDDLPGPNHRLHGSTSTDGPGKLGSTHKLPSLEEEPNLGAESGAESGAIGISPLPTQHRASMAVRSRHIT